MKIKDIIIDIVIVAVIVAVFSVFIKPIIVDGESMEPTLRNRDYLFLSRQAYHVGEPKRGQIVVFPVGEDQLYIKRVVALPGETVAVHDGRVFVNGKEQDQSFTKEGTTIDGINGKNSITVPKGQLFVMGDNRNHSEDSRFIGCINIKDVTGVVIVRLWPLKHIGTLEKQPQ